jgi:UDP-glucose 4-epimerase
VISATAGADVIFHFASNPDIAKAATDPTIDFSEGTVLTQNLLEAARINGVGVFIYASGSGVYGDLPGLRLKEDFGPLKPISPYGASKLAGEAMVSAYSHMFQIKARSLRFANVIGPNQTHGVTFDFVNRLLGNPKSLEVLGDGTQSKPYIHIEDIIQALTTAMTDAFSSGGYEAFNASTDDEVEVREIAEICLKRFGLEGSTKIYYGTESRGWAGDVPKVSLDSSALRHLGWRPQFSSRCAVQRAVDGYLDYLGIEPNPK